MTLEPLNGYEIVEFYVLPSVSKIKESFIELKTNSDVKALCDEEGSYAPVVIVDTKTNKRAIAYIYEVFYTSNSVFIDVSLDVDTIKDYHEAESIKKYEDKEIKLNGRFKLFKLPE